MRRAHSKPFEQPRGIIDIMRNDESRVFDPVSRGNFLSQRFPLSNGKFTDVQAQSSDWSMETKTITIPTRWIYPRRSPRVFHAASRSTSWQKRLARLFSLLCWLFSQGGYTALGLTQTARTAFHEKHASSRSPSPMAILRKSVVDI